MKANTDATKGLLYADDGNGLVAATAALAATKKTVVALASHDYSEVTDHTLSAGVKGLYTVAKKTGTAIPKDAKVVISSDAGYVTVFALGDVTSTPSETTIEAALAALAGVIGTAYAAADSDATTVDIVKE
jgi:hypothetical protein